MEWLTELIKHTPEILKAASANDLALAAFFFLVGAILIFGLLRTANSAVKLMAIIIWFGASLVALLYFVHQKMPEPNYVARIIGQDTEVKGHGADLDLGYVEANAPHEYRLNVKLEGDSSTLEIRGMDAPVSAEISSNTTAKGSDGGQVVTVRFEGPATSSRQTSILRIAKSGSKRTELTIRIHYAAVQSPITVRSDSGPKSSGHGQDTGPTYPLCADAPTQGDFEVVSSRYWLTGDRVCNSWSWCGPGNSSGRQSCFSFNMQGHSECNGGGCDATRNSEGHIEATFKLVPSTPKLTAAAG